MQDAIPQIDLEQTLGAKSEVGCQKLTLYFPNKDKDGQVVPDLEDYVQAAMALLSDINGGVTRLPVASGVWLNEETGKSIFENTTLIYSFIMNPTAFAEKIEDIRDLLFDFGSGTNQGEILVEFSGESMDTGYISRAFRITKFKTEERS